MQAQEMLDLAAILSAQGSLLIGYAGPLANHGLERYWTASKCRLDRWGRSLKRFAEQSACEGPQFYREHGPAVCGVLEEILTGEVLTRVWTALVCAHDRRQASDAGEPVVRSVFIGHQEARHRVLILLVSEPIDAREGFRLNRLRRRADRWADMLVGYLTRGYDTSEFAVEPARAKDFASDLGENDCLPNGPRAWPLIQASLRAAFRHALTGPSPNADLNAAIAGGILGCFPAELFDSTGILRSLWSMRIAAATNDAQGMIGQLLAMDAAPPRGRRFR